jgi:hypothetical protein
MAGHFNHSALAGNAELRTGKGEKKGRTFVRPRGDEVYYAFTDALRRATRPTWGRCPSRAASKTSMPTLNGQRNLNYTQTDAPEGKKVQTFLI